MSLSLEILIKPEKSRTYFRLVLLLNLLSVAQISYSSVYPVVKIGLIVLIIFQFWFDYKNQSPCSSIQEIKSFKNEWILVLVNGTTQHYDKAHILIHNTLFQLIKLSHSKRNKLIVLFNDQLPKTQLRLLHLKIAAN